MKENDLHLLKRFAENDDHNAFGEIVERYLDIAYSAAMACLRKEDLAHDACQMTFLELSRKAGTLSDKVALGGWVFNTARNISRKLLRTEIHRQQREQRYVDQMKRQNTPEIDWSQRAPEIHDALGKIKPVDREIILLRFFKQMSLAEVGKQLDISTDAARMRVNRALEQLNRQFAKKGIRSTAAALAGALPVHAAVSAPAGMSASIAASVVANAGTTGLSTTLIGMTLMSIKTKALIILGVAALTTVVGTSMYKRAQSAGPEEQPLAAEPAEVKPKTVDGVAAGAPESIPALVAREVDSVAEHSVRNDRAREAAELETPYIDPELLRQAENMCEILEFSKGDVMQGMIPRPNPEKDTGALTEKLRLRLSLDADQTRVINEILLANAVARRAGDPVEVVYKLLETDRQHLINVLALEMIGEDKMTPEQKNYMDSAEFTEKERLGITDAPPRWHKNKALLAELNEVLLPEQRADFENVLQEQRVRVKEQRALKRTNEVADTLGLNETDRGALYDYLYENPKASDAEISEQLAPELRELMLEHSAPESPFDFSF